MAWLAKYKFTAQFKFLQETEGTSQISLFRAVVPPLLIRELRRLAQCSVSETLKRFLFGSFFFASKKNEHLKEVLLLSGYIFVKGARAHNLKNIDV
ncbi:hypothetical protein, partial [Megamonas hypermegale]|uniref:hypothetical protein n=1 Tax=Megamonas hypermegale TaxID=158847 RepID=UPI0026EA1A40